METHQRSPIHQSRFQNVPLAAVDLDDHPFAVSPPGDLSRVMASIQEVGLLNPPWLRVKAGGRGQVVTGRKRLSALARLGWEEAPVRLLPADTPDSCCLLIYLYDNAFSRGFDPLEQVLLAARLMEYWDGDTVAQKFLPLLGQPTTAGRLARLLAVSALEEPLRQLLAQGRLALAAAARLAEWPLEDRLAVAPFLTAIYLTQSQQEEFLEGLELLARREGDRIAAILDRAELRACLADTGHTPQEKTAVLRRQLQQWVSPRLSAAQAAFQAGLTRLGLRHHPRLRLEPPPVFEGAHFRLEIKFQDEAELHRLLEELARLARTADFLALTRL